ncbi:MAG: Fic family protein, partial [Rhodanobacteraceae bacterium]
VYHPTAIPQLIIECFDSLLEKARAIEDPFEQAFFIMVQLPYLQAFEDVNKRVSRLAANIPLIKQNLAPLSFVDVPEESYTDGILAVYELNRVDLLRDVFIWAYERSCRRYTLVKQALPEPDPLRLRYRDALMHVVADMVRNGSAITPNRIRQLAGVSVAPADMAEFVALATSELLHLHEGNIARYRLRPSELQRWREGNPA